MESGLAILLVGVLLALIYLYSVTKDRWNWKRIAAWSSVPLILTLTGVVSFFAWIAFTEAHAYSILIIGIALAVAQIWRITKERAEWLWLWKAISGVVVLGILVGASYLSFDKVAAWKESQQQKSEEKREQLARTCIADDIPRMESVLHKIGSEIRQGASQGIYDKTHSILKSNSVEQIKVVAANDDILEKVVVGVLPTKCDSKFHFLLDVRFTRDQVLRWFRVFAQNKPKGYEPRTTAWNVEYAEESLTRTLNRGAKIIFDDPFADIPVLPRLELEELRELRARKAAEKIKILGQLKIINVQDLSGCEFGSRCDYVRIAFDIKNSSGQKISKVIYGHVLVNENVPCPPKDAKLSKTGETSDLWAGDVFSVILPPEPLPYRRSYRLCVRAIDVNF